jgi:hypothetical protein
MVLPIPDLEPEPVQQASTERKVKHDQPRPARQEQQVKASSAAGPERSHDDHTPARKNLGQTRFNGLLEKTRPLAPAHTPFHYPGWHGKGYPKGLGHGPIVWRYDNRKDKMVKVEGLSYESLGRKTSDSKSSWQKMLDEQPYDEAGQLRIFRHGTSGTQLIVEWDSDQAAVMNRNAMDNRAKSMFDSGVDISYGKRPRLDDRDTDEKMTFPTPKKSRRK